MRFDALALQLYKKKKNSLFVKSGPQGPNTPGPKMHFNFTFSIIDRFSKFQIYKIKLIQYWKKKLFDGLAWLAMLLMFTRRSGIPFPMVHYFTWLFNFDHNFFICVARLSYKLMLRIFGCLTCSLSTSKSWIFLRFVSALMLLTYE